jgi:LEA14-like dessication related protein
MRHTMKKMMAGMFVGSSAMLLLSGCQGMVQKPQVRVVSLSYANITGSAQTIGVRLSVRNPNIFAIPIQSGSATVTINGQPFAQGAVPHMVTLPAGQSVLVTVPVRTNTTTLESDLPEILLNGKVSYLVSGQVFVHGEGETPYPFTYKGTLTWAQVENMIPHVASGAPSMGAFPQHVAG